MPRDGVDHEIHRTCWYVTAGIGVAQGGELASPADGDVSGGLTRCLVGSGLQQNIFQSFFGLLFKVIERLEEIAVHRHQRADGLLVRRKLGVHRVRAALVADVGVSGGCRDNRDRAALVADVGVSGGCSVEGYLVDVADVGVPGV